MEPLRLFVACLACAALAACDSPRSELDRHDLGAAAQQLESIAAEGSWLAQQLQERSVTVSFAWVDQRALGEDASKAAQDAMKTAPAQLRPQQEQLAQLAARLQVELSRIAPAAADASDLARLQRELQSIAAALHPLAQAA